MSTYDLQKRLVCLSGSTVESPEEIPDKEQLAEWIQQARQIASKRS